MLTGGRDKFERNVEKKSEENRIYKIIEFFIAASGTQLEIPLATDWYNAKKSVPYNFFRFAGHKLK